MRISRIRVAQWKTSRNQLVELAKSLNKHRVAQNIGAVYLLATGDTFFDFRGDQAIIFPRMRGI